MSETPFRKTVAVDFDGPIHAYTRGWQEGVIYDEPTAGALDAIATLAEEYRVVVFTARTELEPVRDWLIEHGFKDFIEEVTNGKPQAQVYDRAVYFDTKRADPWYVALGTARHVMEHHANLKLARGEGA
jgi:hypothetical protein